MSDPHGPVDYDPNAPHYSAEFAARLRKQRIAGWLLIAWVLIVTAFIAVTIFGLIEIPPRAWYAIFPAYFVPVLAYSLFGMINCRCPRCNKNQTRLRNPRFCFNCGLRLRE